MPKSFLNRRREEILHAEVSEGYFLIPSKQRLSDLRLVIVEIQELL